MVPAREVEAISHGLSITDSLIYKLITQQSIEYEVLIDIPVIRKRQQWVHLIYRKTVFASITIRITSCTVAVNIRVIGRISVITNLVFHIQFMIVRTKFSRILQERIPEETLRSLRKAIIVARPVSIIDPVLTERILSIRITFDMGRYARHSITDRSRINRSGNTVISGSLLLDLWCHEVSVKTSRPVIMQLRLTRQLHVITIHSRRTNDTIRSRITQRKWIVSFIEGLSYIYRVTPSNASLEEIFRIIISLGSSPWIQSCRSTLRHIVLSIMQSTFRIFILYITAIYRIIRQVRDRRSPAKSRIWVISTFITLSIFSL